MKNSINQRIDEVFKQVGEFGTYQLIMIILVGIISFVPAFVGYSFSFYAATPQYRCKIPILENDTYEVMSEYHQQLIDKYIPPPSDKSFKDKYDKCLIRSFVDDQTNETSKNVKCKQWVYSRQYYDETIITEWNLVCDNTKTKSLFSTLYFVGTYGVLLSGVLSDKFGRKKTAYLFLIANALVNILLTIVITVKFENNILQQYVFAVIRLFSGICTNVYAVAVVLSIEICGPAKRITAANFAYYLYIAGEFVLVLLAYFIRNYRTLYLTYTGILVSFVLYFWIVPESPRWLMAKYRNSEAYKIFKRIAISNGKNLDELHELNSLRKVNSRLVSVEDSSISPVKNDDIILENSSPEEKHITAIQTMKIFFHSKKLMLRSLVILLNWLTNTLVYYGISFNTSELFGDPYLNFALSVVLELFAILVSHYTLQKFGRKIPYSINMALSGVSLILVMFIPTNAPIVVTILALVAKFGISFTYNAIYIITAEIYPTVIRNSSVSICQTFARLGAVVAPNLQLLGDLFWYPIPFLVYGFFSIISFIGFILLIPETKNRKLPDTIEEFIQ